MFMIEEKIELKYKDKLSAYVAGVMLGGVVGVISALMGNLLIFISMT